MKKKFAKIFFLKIIRENKSSLKILLNFFFISNKKYIATWRFVIFLILRKKCFFKKFMISLILTKYKFLTSLKVI